MPWQDETIPTLRILISDLSSSPTYSDERLEQTLVVAAKLIQQEMSFDVDYTCSIENITISPDPVGTDDKVFETMMVLKAACIVDQGTFRAKALLEGIRASVGPASLTVTGHLNGFLEIMKNGPCAAYQQLKTDVSFGNLSVVKAVLSPFSGNLFDPRSVLGYNTYSTRR
jgi:hypothetical protein